MSTIFLMFKTSEIYNISEIGYCRKTCPNCERPKSGRYGNGPFGAGPPKRFRRCPPIRERSRPRAIIPGFLMGCPGLFSRRCGPGPDPIQRARLMHQYKKTGKNLFQPVARTEVLSDKNLYGNFLLIYYKRFCVNNYQRRAVICHLFFPPSPAVSQGFCACFYGFLSFFPAVYPRIPALMSRKKPKNP